MGTSRVGLAASFGWTSKVARLTHNPKVIGSLVGLHGLSLPRRNELARTGWLCLFCDVARSAHTPWGHNIVESFDRLESCQTAV